MPKQQSEKMLRELELRAKEFGDKSTKLSNMLEEAEAFLQRMPAKVQVNVEQLSFRRSPHVQEWKLWYESEVVTESSVAIKARAARLLPPLVKELFSSLSNRLVEVDAGLEALSRVPFLGEEDQQ